MEEASVSESVPDLKDLEVKIGRKTPEGLLRWMREESSAHRPELKQNPPDSKEKAGESNENAPEGKGLDEKIRKLKLEMALLRAVDVRILQQLLALHEGIEAVKWLLEERGGALASRCSSLTSSQYSLAEGPDTSWRGSWSSLHDPHDRLDNISVGSYLDTLADELDEYGPPSSGGESVSALSSATPGGDGVAAVRVGTAGSGSATGSPKVKPPEVGKKEEAPVPVRTPQTDTGKAASVASQEGSPARPSLSNGALGKALKQAGGSACAAEALGKTQSPPAKTCRNGRVDMDGCKLNGKMHLEYDAHWRWVQSQDDVTFL